MDCVSNVQSPMVVIFSSDLQNEQQVSRLAYGIAVSFKMLAFNISFSSTKVAFTLTEAETDKMACIVLCGGIHTDTTPRH